VRRWRGETEEKEKIEGRKARRRQMQEEKKEGRDWGEGGHRRTYGHATINLLRLRDW